MTQPSVGSKHSLLGQAQNEITWFELGGQLQAPTEQVSGKFETDEQHETVSTVPPVIRHFPSAPLAPADPFVPPEAPPAPPRGS